MNPDLFWIPGPWPGRLAVVTRPRGGDWLEDEVGGWKQAGLDLVVSLLEDDEASQLELSDEDATARSRGIRFISFPIPDRSVPASLPDAVGLIREIAKALREGRNVAVHCRQGVGRSGMIASGVLVVSGAEPRKAIEAVSAARGQNVPETPAQLRWIQSLPTEQLVGTR
jgi:protein-tyrosine phosphatase